MVLETKFFKIVDDDGHVADITTDGKLQVDGTISVETSYYRQQLAYDVDGDVEYIGLAIPGSTTTDPIWQIKKFTYDVSKNVLTIRYADGIGAFTKVWDNRAGYSY